MSPPIGHSLRLKPNHLPKEVNQNLRKDKSVYVKEWKCLLIVSHVCSLTSLKYPFGVWPVLEFVCVTSKCQNPKKSLMRSEKPSVATQRWRLAAAMYFSRTCLLWYSNKEFHQFLALRMYSTAFTPHIWNAQRKISVRLNIQFPPRSLPSPCITRSSCQSIVPWIRSVTRSHYTHTHKHTHCPFLACLSNLCLIITALKLSQKPYCGSAEASLLAKRDCHSHSGTKKRKENLRQDFLSASRSAEGYKAGRMGCRLRCVPLLRIWVAEHKSEWFMKTSAFPQRRRRIWSGSEMTTRLRQVVVLTQQEIQRVSSESGLLQWRGSCSLLFRLSAGII